MKQITEFFQGLFATNQWPARWHCGHWTDFHGWLYIVSDLMVWLAYFLMPIIIIHYARKKKPGLKFHSVYLLFAAFILLCGTTHLLDAFMFWVPAYRVNALVRFITGVVSLFTVYYLIKILPEAFKQKTSRELEAEITRREAAEHQLEEANKGLEAFAYIASHDLQEPLRKIRTYSSMLQDANAACFDEKSKDYTTKIINSSSKMQHLIRDILTLSEINSSVAVTSVSIKDAVENAKEDLEIKILESGAVINCEEMPEVKGNKTYLSQLFMNLISNSIKFSSTAPVVNISARRNGNKVIITVADNGIGMEQSDTDKIFEAFSRLKSKSEYSGSGLGLAICKKIVDVHHGKIEVCSKEGEGTCFTIELPAD